MPLIKSIAGIRGTIGGKIGDGLTPIDIVQITTAFGEQQLQYTKKPTVVIGRDARPSGTIVSHLVSATLESLGIQVVDLGLTTTPTVALAVKQLQASGGIMVSASHNPSQWNALKLLNQAGEYIDAATANNIFALADKGDFIFASNSDLGSYTYQANYIDEHIKAILALPIINKTAIQERNFKIAVDPVNSVGSIAVPRLLAALGVKQVTLINGDTTGMFMHDPEPLPEHLYELANTVKQDDYDIGIAVDPDVDRLAIIDENGQAWGEDYTVVAAADYVLAQTPGPTVSNLSSSRALQVLTAKYNQPYAASPVGEMHVVAAMKANHAVIGGEGNGGVIYPNLHYNRDALMGIALVLSHLAQSGQNASALRASYPHFCLLKDKINLTAQINTVDILNHIAKQYPNYPIDQRDGIKVDLEQGWFLLRQSNTEPVIRLHVEANNQEEALKLMQQLKQTIHNLI